MLSQEEKLRKTSFLILPNLFLVVFIEGDVTTEAGSLFQYFTTLTEKTDPFFRRWLLPRSTLYGCTSREWEGEKLNIQNTQEYIEFSNQISLNSSSLQGMKAQLLQYVFVGKVTNASYQPCCSSLNTLQMADIHQDGISY